jgi:hypothetical protein
MHSFHELSEPETRVRYPRDRHFVETFGKTTTDVSPGIDRGPRRPDATEVAQVSLKIDAVDTAGVGYWIAEVTQ